MYNFQVVSPISPLKKVSKILSNSSEISFSKILSLEEITRDATHKVTRMWITAKDKNSFQLFLHLKKELVSSVYLD